MAKHRGAPEKKEFEEKLLEIRRVTKVTTGGRRLSFRATILIGNKKGKIGIGTGKGTDVSIAVRKAVHDAYKNVKKVNITNDGSILYPISIKNKASNIKLLPASPGTGLKAGSSVRLVLELAGYSNILSKIVGSNNKLNNALTTVAALTSFKLKDSHKKLVMQDSDVKADKKEVKKTENKDGDKKETKKPVKKEVKKEVKAPKTKEEPKKTTKK